MSAFKQADRNKTVAMSGCIRKLKEDSTKPPAASLRAQQSRFDNFRYVFNNERPHEGLNNQVPASLYHPSSVRLPRKLPEFTYPKGLLCDA
jgi:transposase InsO family protein